MKKLFFLLLLSGSLQAQTTWQRSRTSDVVELRQLDSLSREVYYLRADSSGVVIRGDYKLAVQGLIEFTRQENELLMAARLVTAQITNSGMVRSRVLLTKAITDYNSVKLKYGITF